MKNAVTEREMLDALRKRYSQVNPGNGPRYAIAEHVKSSAGFDARRQADMIVMDLWPSTALPLIGHEVKCSRSDWLNELKDPDKAETFKRYMSEWYLVISDAAFIKEEELPSDWGLIVRTSSGSLRMKKQAPRLQPEPLPQTMLATLLRATSLTGRSMGREAALLEAKRGEVCRWCSREIFYSPQGRWAHQHNAWEMCNIAPYYRKRAEPLEAA